MARTPHSDRAVRALMISDLHLDPSRPEITALFLRFLQEEAAQAEALYIPGDLFETWIGDDDDAPLAHEVATALSSTAAHGTQIYFLRGNRDFLLGPTYAARAGFTILPDPCIILLNDTPTLLLHGDLLCWDDTAYLAVRRQVRDPAWQAAMLSRSLAERRAFAEAARASSAAHQQSMDLSIGDAAERAVQDYFRRYGVTRMIHGHTHRPAIHRLTIDGRECERIVLGDWYEQGSVLRIFTDGSLELASLPLSN